MKTITQAQVISNQIYDQVKDLPGLDWIFSYIPHPKVMQRFSEFRGGNSLGQAGIDHDQMGK